MAARANYVKVGVFVLLGVAAAAILAIVTGVLHARRETSYFVTYFDESVQGLEVGAPVNSRGVTIGRVGKITFAPDHRLVEVRMDFDVSTLRQMGVPKEVPPEVRVQLASQGVLGTRFLNIEFFDPKTHPPLVLSFAPPENYIPSTPSLQKSLENSLTTALDRLAQLMDAVVREGITQKLAQSLEDIDQLLEPFNREKLPTRAAKALDDARAALGKINKALDRVDGDAGLIASAQGAVKSFGDVGKNAGATTRSLSATLTEMRAAAAAIRSLAEELERNPDMLLKGVKRPGAP